MKIHQLLVFSALLFTLVSCDQCKDVSCLNNGVCLEGTCECETGFSGANCEIEDKCITNEVSCENGKECVDGTCDCGDWYEGNTCAIKVVNNFVGSYQGYFGCSNQSGFVSLGALTATENELKIIEYTGREYSCVFLTESSFEIPSQTLPEEHGYGPLQVSGQGAINTAGELQYSVTYNYPSQGSSTTCLFSGQ